MHKIASKSYKKLLTYDNLNCVKRNIKCFSNGSVWQTIYLSLIDLCYQFCLSSNNYGQMVFKLLILLAPGKREAINGYKYLILLIFTNITVYQSVPLFEKYLLVSEVTLDKSQLSNKRFTSSDQLSFSSKVIASSLEPSTPLISASIALITN